MGSRHASVPPSETPSLYTTTNQHQASSLGQQSLHTLTTAFMQAAVGIRFAEIDATTDELVTIALGMVIDGERLEVRPKPETLSNISVALVPLIRGLPATGHDLEIIVGHLVSVMMVSRWALSFLMHCYRFISAGGICGVIFVIVFGKNFGVFGELCLCYGLQFQTTSVPRFSLFMHV